ncbi:MAG: LytTR family DNA-binding domain-containing protein [Puia sp.]|nr:LytTR family DNA-binding domain-containing protein [Puia sp.]
MRVLIIEDEKPAYENLAGELLAIDHSISVIAGCDSVQECIRWLNRNPQPDLIMMDIQLSDGLSFNIFGACSITCPVIFTTAYDKYLTQAFEYSSIDYLLKPINPEKLKNAIKKYKNLQNHFVNNHASLLEFLNNHDKKKSRILVKKGIEYQTVRVEDIAYFFTEHKLVFLVDKENRKYLAEKNNLGELEEELDRNLFYRANRKFIINANYVRRFKPLERSKISVELALPANEEIIISQENAASFKKWMGDC